MALSANREIPHYIDQELREYPVEAAKKIFKGALTSFSADGHLQPLVAADNAFGGIAYEASDNTAGSDGDKKCRVYTIGDFEFPLSGATQADVNKAVYASADDTLTLTSASNTYVGYIVGVPASGLVIVRLDFGRTAP
jgi:hypothetical protein